ncbi:GNAT family N-acetyltransferase [Bdellovibrio sp. SKB1291214]|uniref:GNAT family N-acetyltransferase n=1 Tax=Bdellovibrio sp. SKB1291214 TaxID=1732569 RepID=UPI000B5181AE|nr:GNAT family N-acetyltransferase [Bdellovibrio sp. SKB1291214]UYL10465.1 GNAT family N-acetyltransferase [Bdellovibrio sp. SKB1291214]
MNSARLTLRRFNLNDFHNMRELEADPEVIRYSPHRYPLSDEKIKERLQLVIENEKSREPLGIWAAEITDTKDFVGWFMLLQRDQPYIELGFMIVRRQWGKGFTTEAVKRLTEYALDELKLPGLSAITDEDNHASANVLVKSGFKLIRQYTDFDKVWGKEIKINQYELKR